MRDHGATAKRRPAAAATSRLRRYHAKRNLAKSGEPAAGRAGGAEKFPRFVIQKHDASHLHYDFRLEMEGVLRSWAVPKGLPEKIGAKALAIEVEDHPLDYGGFEGVIPAGNYGGGTVMLWDRGIYTVEGGSPQAAYRAGKIHLGLVGKKCVGEWTLVRLRSRQSKEKVNWLVIKNRRAGHQRAPATAPVSRQVSVLTGRTMEEIATGRKAARRPAERVTAAAPDEPGAALPPPPTRAPRGAAGFIEPMKALAVTAIPAGDWRLEVKFDGYRALAVVKGKRVELWSRNRKPLSADYPGVVADLAKLRCRSAVIDGEIVALDSSGRSRFQLLQQRELPGARPVVYYAFDLLHRDGVQLHRQPIEERREELEKLFRGHQGVARLSPVFKTTPEKLLGEIRRRGLEGIVAKAAGSVYEPGRRSGQWLKCRVSNEQEFVIGGFTPPEGSRRHFGALLIGYYEGPRLIYAGKVGTGFDARLLASLSTRFAGRVRATCPFANLPLQRSSRFAEPMNAAAMRRVQWLRPDLVCQVRFAEWTQDGSLRHPVFLGLRNDKPARAVVREAPAV